MQDDAIISDPRVQAAADEQPFPLVFLTISGAHLYGFASPDSDVDLRGVHRLPLRTITGLSPEPQTIDSTRMVEGLEVDVTTHDAGMYAGMLRSRNGNVLDQVYSRLVVRTSDAHEELRDIARAFITRHHAHHYDGLARSRRQLLDKQEAPTVKPLLYLYRAVLAGIWLMRTGEIEPDLRVLLEHLPQDGVADLIARKQQGHEAETLQPGEMERHIAATETLRDELAAARDASSLPDRPGPSDRLHDWLVRLRLAPPPVATTPGASTSGAGRLIREGTSVVLLREIAEAGGGSTYPAGSVGVVIRQPDDATHSYRLRMPDHGEAMGPREALITRAEHSASAIGRSDLTGVTGDAVLADYNLHEHVIYRAVVGSRAYGLDSEASDTDRRGIYLPPASLHWSMWGVPEQLENRETDEVYWELQKFLVLALKSNPNVLEVLYSPLVEHASPVAEEMLAMRDAFLSRLAFQTYNGYVMAQFRKLQQSHERDGRIKWKHAMHLIRLQLAGVLLLREGTLQVRVPDGAARERLLAIREGAVPFAEVDAWRQELHREMESARDESPLPVRPDHEQVNAFLIRARASAV